MKKYKIKFLLLFVILINISISGMLGCFGKNKAEKEDPEFYYQLSLEQLKLGNNNEAIDNLQKILKINSKSIKARQMLGVIYSKMGKNIDSINENMEILKIDPANVSALNFLGAMYTKEKDYKNADIYFKKAVDASPADFFTYNNYGLFLSETGDSEHAIEMYKKSAEINPKFVFALVNLGDLYVKGKKYQEALSELDKAEKLEPENQQVLNSIGIAYHKKGEIDTAISYFQKAIKVNPKNFRTHFNLGNLYADKGDINNAETEYRYTISENTAFAPVYDRLGFLYTIKKDNVKTGFDMVNKAIEIDPLNKGQYMDTLSWLYYNTGDYNKAIQTATEGEELLKKANRVISDDAKYHIGIIYKKLGDKEKASTYLSEYINAEKNILKSRVEEYGRYLAKKDWEALYYFQSPEFKAKVSSVEYGQRHPEIGSSPVSSFINNYEVSNVDFNDDLVTANINILITKGLKGMMLKEPQILRDKEPIKEKWEKVNNVWFRSAVPEEITPAMHISGAAMR